MSEKKLPIGLQVYSVRNEAEKDLYNALVEIRKMGYDGVEFAGFYGNAPEEVAKMLKETALICLGAHIGIENLEGGALDKTVYENQIIGNRRLIIPSLPPEFMENEESWLKAAYKMNEISEILAKFGMVTGYHNHAVEFQKTSFGLPYDLIASNTIDRVIMQLDTGNAACGGGNFYRCLEQYPGRAKSVHFKPWSHQNGYDVKMAEDDTDWQKLYRLCVETGGAECIIVEYESLICFENPMDAAADCLRALKSAGI